MNRSSKRRRQPPEPELRLKRSQRREIVIMITSDDMKLRLKQLADQGRQDDTLFPYTTLFRSRKSVV